MPARRPSWRGPLFGRHRLGDAIGRYAADVRDGAFPEEQHTYSIPAEELALFEDAVAEVRAR